MRNSAWPVNQRSQFHHSGNVGIELLGGPIVAPGHTSEVRPSGQLEELDVAGILAFAERILPRAADLWVQASLDQRQRFQQLFFPDGVAFDEIGLLEPA